MSVLFIVRVYNNVQFNRQLSFEYVQNVFSYDDIHRHSKIYYGICLHSANVNCFVRSFGFFSFFFFVSCSVQLILSRLCSHFLWRCFLHRSFSVSVSVLSPGATLWSCYTHIHA